MISFDEFLKQDEADKYNMLQECNAIIQQKENIIKEVIEYINKLSTLTDCEYELEPVEENILEILDKENK